MCQGGGTCHTGDRISSLGTLPDLALCIFFKSGCSSISFIISFNKLVDISKCPWVLWAVPANNWIQGGGGHGNLWLSLSQTEDVDNLGTYSSLLASKWGTGLRPYPVGSDTNTRQRRSEVSYTAGPLTGVAELLHGGKCPHLWCQKCGELSSLVGVNTGFFLMQHTME